MTFQCKMFGTFVKSKEMHSEEEDRGYYPALEQEVADSTQRIALTLLSTKVAADSTQRIALTLLSTKVDKIQSKIDDFTKSVQDGTTSGAQLSTIQDALSQCYGNLEKLQFTEIDAVVTGDLTTGKDTARTLRKQLSKRTGTLLNIVEGLVTEIKNRRNRK